MQDKTATIVLSLARAPWVVMSSELRAAADEVGGGLVGGDGSSGAPRVVEGAVSVEVGGGSSVREVEGTATGTAPEIQRRCRGDEGKV